MCVCTLQKRSERQHTQLAQPYLPTSRLIPSVCFFNAPPFTFSFIVRFAAVSPSLLLVILVPHALLVVVLQAARCPLPVAGLFIA